MLEKLTTAADLSAANTVARQIERLAQTSTSPGVEVDATNDGIILSGKGLRKRMLTDAKLRNFGK